jgi:undecaprenyl-diphosphatase
MDIILLLKIIFLSFIQGISEFFPISSSGHLVIFQNVLGMGEVINDLLLYDIFLHIGTLLSVIIFFYGDLKELVFNFRKKENFEFIKLIITASIPTAIIGLFFKDQLEKMFDKPQLVGYTLVITGIVLFISKYIKLNRINIYFTVFIIGFIQGIAIIPGLSRSGLTISIALILAMGYEFSFKFSFILSIPAILGALVLKLKDFQVNDDIVYMVIGLILAALFGLIALKILKKIILKKKFHYFSYYCMFAGIITIIVLS